jgi:hypothetical protein
MGLDSFGDVERVLHRSAKSGGRKQSNKENDDDQTGQADESTTQTRKAL